MHTLDRPIVPLRSESPPQKRSGMAGVLKGSHSQALALEALRDALYKYSTTTTNNTHAHSPL